MSRLAAITFLLPWLPLNAKMFSSRLIEVRLLEKVFNNTIGATGRQFPHNTKDVQSLMSNACGWFCLAFLHYINAFPKRTKNLYDDTDAFLGMFDDLNKHIDWKKNEYMLKQFFQSGDPKLRKSIDVYGDGIHRITSENTEPIDLTKV